MKSRALKITGMAVAAFGTLIVLFVLLFDWN